jgi:hypothetical protein
MLGRIMDEKAEISAQTGYNGSGGPNRGSVPGFGGLTACGKTQ